MEEQKKKRGRPRKEEPLSRVYGFRMSEKEYQELKHICFDRGVCMSEIISDSIKLYKKEYKY